MVKHTQTIRRLLPMNCLSVFDHFVGLKGFKAGAPFHRLHQYIILCMFENFIFSNVCVPYQSYNSQAVCPSNAVWISNNATILKTRLVIWYKLCKLVRERIQWCYHYFFYFQGWYRQKKNTGRLSFHKNFWHKR